MSCNQFCNMGYICLSYKIKTYYYYYYVFRINKKSSMTAMVQVTKFDVINWLLWMIKTNINKQAIFLQTAEKKCKHRGFIKHTSCKWSGEELSVAPLRQELVISSCARINCKNFQFFFFRDESLLSCMCTCRGKFPGYLQVGLIFAARGLISRTAAGTSSLTCKMQGVLVPIPLIFWQTAKNKSYPEDSKACVQTTTKLWLVNQS